MAGSRGFVNPTLSAASTFSAEVTTASAVSLVQLRQHYHWNFKDFQ